VRGLPVRGDAMTWDVFLSERLELRRGLSGEEIRAAMARGELRDDDLVRPAGSSEPWAPLADLPALMDVMGGSDSAHAPASAFVVPVGDRPTTPAGTGTDEDAEAISLGWTPEVDGRGDEEELDEGSSSFDQIAGAFEPIRDEAGGQADPGAAIGPGAFAPIGDEDESYGTPSDSSVDALADAGPAGVVPSIETGELGRFDLDLDRADSRVALPAAGRATTAWDEPRAVAGLDFEPEAEAVDPLEEDEEAAEFTLSRGGPEKVEELDLAAMVDVAFQLVLFFLVTATTVLYKTLEVPRPNPEQAQSATQGQGDQPKSLEDLEADYILVGIDPQGAFTIDREPVDGTFDAVVERLRKARKDTGRTAMLLTADAAAQHRLAVVAYDAANEIGLRIAIARPPARRANEPPAPPPERKAAAG
jgi:biopolymer transport protein ExbD